MAENDKIIRIPGRLHSVATEGIVTGADEIFDDSLNKDQATINQEVNEALGTGGSVDSRIAAAINELDASASQTAALSNGNLNLSVTETDGKVTAISGSIDDAAYIDDTESSPAVVPGFDPITDTVHVTAQTLSEQQKTQARTNIGLGDVDAKINQAVASETNRAVSAESSLGNKVNSINQGVTQQLNDQDAKLDNIQATVNAKQLEIGAVETDLVPTKNSPNRLTSGTLYDVYGHYKESPEFIKVELDKEDKVLEGMRKDGTKVIGSDLLVNGDAKVIGETEIGGVSYKAIENPELVEVKLDSRDKIIEGIRNDGTKIIPGGVEVGGNKVMSYTDLENRIEMTLDGEKKIISFRKSNGTLVESAGIKTPFISADSLLLSNKGLDELKDRLDIKDAGIKITKITVKKDGSGDYASIQEAINSITDASENNRYEIEIYDDFVSSAFTDLYFMEHPTVKLESEADINAYVSYVTTKNWVSLIGKGEKRKIWFINPDIDTPARLFQHIHVMYVQGNCRLENLDIRIKGGRYAVHQDRSASTNPNNNIDVNATTVYDNCHIEHLGNDEYTYGSGWDSTYAIAACPSSGQTIKIRECYITSKTDPFGFHLHKNYRDKATYILEHTTIVCSDPNLSLDEISSMTNDFGTNQRNELIMVGCNIPHLNGSGKQLNGYDMEKGPTDIECGGIFVSGHGNEKAYIQCHTIPGIYVRSANVNSQVNVTGGTAKPLIFGNNPVVYRGDSKNYGITVGNLGISINGDTIFSTHSYIRSLPYLLGNCASNPKTLIVNVDGTDHTVIFNKNYMTSDGSAYGPSTQPAISGDAIIQEINQEFSQYFIVGKNEDMPYTMHPPFLKLYSFSDCMEIGVNTSNECWKPWQCVKRDYTKGVKGWRLAVTGEIPDGIVGERICAPYDGKYYSGAIILTDKAIFGYSTCTKNMVVNAGTGTMLEVGNDSYLTATQNPEAPFVVISENGTFVKK